MLLILLTSLQAQAENSTSQGTIDNKIFNTPGSSVQTARTKFSNLQETPKNKFDHNQNLNKVSKDGFGENNKLNVPTNGINVSDSFVSVIFPIGILLFGTLVAYFQYKYMLQIRPTPDVSLPSFVLTLIITGTLVLVSFEVDLRVMSTVVGLFGTIAGYVLGRSTPRLPPNI